MLDLDPHRPLLVFGGPYSNVQATRALIAIAAQRDIAAGQVICTGDVVAYGADPEATVEAIRAWGCHVIAGNCEQQLASGAGDCGCGFDAGSACAILAKGWYPYADRLISAGSRAWMAGLPTTLRFNYGRHSVHVVHGSADVTNRFLFASEHAALDAALDRADADVVLAGHCGLPFAHGVAGRNGSRRLWLNAGVIGMPANDGTPDTWYAIIERVGDDVRATLHRLRYDHHTAAAAMRRSGHANPYARTVVTGLWPNLDILPANERAATGRSLDPAPVRVSGSAAGRLADRLGVGEVEIPREINPRIL